MEDRKLLDRTLYVSYLVTSYNHNKYILDCLNSIKEDFLPNSEIIILDDGSTDNSQELIEGWIQKNENLNARLIVQPNRGVAAALNRLFKEAKGKFIRSVASDDRILKGSTEFLISKLSARKDKMVVFGDSEIIDKNSKRVFESSIIQHIGSIDIYKKDLYWAIIAKWAVCGPCWLSRQGFCESIGPYAEGLIIEDWNMFLRLVADRKIFFVEERVAQYRIHGANVSRTKDISRRIHNLLAQINGGRLNKGAFRFPYSILLYSELCLLRAKVNYLYKRYIRTLAFMSLFSLSRCVAMICVVFVLQEHRNG